ncbi:hypothetical protein NMG60_11026300 [Bertholletia excelsa]
MEREDGVVVMGRAEIDMRAPFRSVKEAVLLFGEKILAGEVYANKLKKIQTGTSEHKQYPSRLDAVSAELEETKQSLQKARDEGHLMANCLKSLHEELELTKRELKQLKAREFLRQLEDPEMEQLKFIENTKAVEENAETEDGLDYFEKKRSVKFASPPSLIRVITSKDVGEVTEVPSSTAKKPRRKPLIPLIGGLFSGKKGYPRR